MRNIVLFGNNNIGNVREFTVLPESFEICVEPLESGFVDIDFRKNDSSIYSTSLHLEKELFDYFEEDFCESIYEDDLSDFILRMIADDLAYYANYQYNGDADEAELYGLSYFDLKTFIEKWEDRLQFEIRHRIEDEKEERNNPKEDDEDK